MEAVQVILVVQRISLLISTRFAWKLQIIRFFTHENGGKRLPVRQGKAFPLVFGRLLRKTRVTQHEHKREESYVGRAYWSTLLSAPSRSDACSGSHYIF